jgi:hypothetical protein
MAGSLPKYRDFQLLVLIDMQIDQNEGTVLKAVMDREMPEIGIAESPMEL